MSPLNDDVKFISILMFFCTKDFFSTSRSIIVFAVKNKTLPFLNLDSIDSFRALFLVICKSAIDAEIKQSC